VLGEGVGEWILIPNQLVLPPLDDVGYVGLILHSMQMDWPDNL
jgi:hypothetical protein